MKDMGPENPNLQKHHEVCPSNEQCLLLPDHKLSDAEMPRSLFRMIPQKVVG